MDEQCLSSVRNLKVCDLFVPGTNEWDVAKVHNLFSSSDAKFILAIPIPINQVQDRIVWNYSLDGKYSAKTGYRFWQQHYGQCKQLEESKGWGRLWKIQVPQKIKIFLWRVCRNNIPVRNMLRGKGVNTTILCPLCGIDVEHLRHICLECNYAKGCWNELGMGFDTSQILSCSDWLLQTLATESVGKLAQIATILWGIWSARNMRVWQDKIVTTQLAMQWSVMQVKQWRDSQQSKILRNKAGVQVSENEVVKWHPPTEGRMKINVDAHVITGLSWFSVGLIIRDHEGRFIRARTRKVAGKVSVVEAEARGLLEALRWANSLGFHGVDVESDSKNSVHAINNTVENYLEVGAIFQECRSLLSDRRDISISFVKKQANKVAHILARVPCDVDCFSDFITPPQSVLELLVSESLVI